MLNNIELRLVANNNQTYEIVKWYKNSYYNKESEYIKKGHFYVKDLNSMYSIHENCFKNPKSCYVVAFIHKQGKLDIYYRRIFQLYNPLLYIKVIYLLIKGYYLSFKL